MKKRFKIFLIFIFMFSIPCLVWADVDVSLKCLEEVMIGNSLECQVSLLNSGQSIKGIQLNYGYDPVFSYLKTENGDEWDVASANNQGFVFLNLNSVTQDSEVANVSFLVSNDAEVSKEYEISLSNIQLSDGSQDISIANKATKVKVLSIFDVLESITVGDTTLELKDGVTEYTINIPYTTTDITIDALLTDDKYEFLDNSGPTVLKDLKVGETIASLKIGLENHELVTFQIHINRLKENQTLEETVDNPKTGIRSLIIVCSLLLVSLLVVFCYSRRVKKVDEI